LHPLYGPRLKVQRAKREIQRLRQEEKAFQQEAEYEIVKAEPARREGWHVYRLRVNYQPPLDDEWGVWIGEIAHNLRSALDGLVYQLAILNGKEPDRETGFPIYRSRQDFKGRGKRLIDLLRDDHQALIESLQPYHLRQSVSIAGRITPVLLCLRELNNADKHRLLQVVGVKPGGGPFVTGWGDPESVWHRVTILKDGAEFLEAGPRAQVGDEIMPPRIGFSEGCETVKLGYVCFTLDTIATHVSDIVESFEPDFA
jgi:hypothetical protein